MQVPRILVVCTANICRSPMAERLLTEFLVRHAEDVEAYVSSAGTHARPGHPAASGMQRVAATWGLDLSYHRSTRVETGLVTQQDLVVTMEDSHRTFVSRLGAGVGQRTFGITELDALVASGARPAGPEATFADHVRAWHAARARLAVDAPDVADPYGGPAAGYERAARELAALVERLGPALAAAMRTGD